MFQLHVRTSWSPEPTLSRDATPTLTGRRRFWDEAAGGGSLARICVPVDRGMTHGVLGGIRMTSM
jgi:hypothetical protein